MSEIEQEGYEDAVFELSELIQSLETRGPTRPGLEDDYYFEDLPFLRKDLERLIAHQMSPELNSTKIFLIESDQDHSRHLSKIGTADDLEIFTHSLRSFINNKKIFGAKESELVQSLNLLNTISNWDQGLRRARFPTETFEDLAIEWIQLLRTWPQIDSQIRFALTQKINKRCKALSQMPHFQDQARLLKALSIGLSL
jgi:hypothetical protein